MLQFLLLFLQFWEGLPKRTGQQRCHSLAIPNRRRRGWEHRSDGARCRRGVLHASNGEGRPAPACNRGSPHPTSSPLATDAPGLFVFYVKTVASLRTLRPALIEGPMGEERVQRFMTFSGEIEAQLAWDLDFEQPTVCGDPVP